MPNIDYMNMDLVMIERIGNYVITKDQNGDDWLLTAAQWAEYVHYNIEFDPR